VLEGDRGELFDGVAVQVFTEREDRRVHHEGVVVLEQSAHEGQEAAIEVVRVGEQRQRLTAHLDLRVVERAFPVLAGEQRPATPRAKSQYALARVS